MIDERKEDQLKKEYKKILHHYPTRAARTDCLMYNEDKHICKGLIGLFCEHEECVFYKPKEGSSRYV